MEKILEVKNLCTEFRTEDGTIQAVDGISFSLEKGKTLGIVGESGCGKSVTALSVMRLIQAPGLIKSGEIKFGGKQILSLSDDEMRKVRGNEISMIFQEPMTSLNPVYTCGNQIDEVIKLHKPELKASQVKENTIAMLKKVGIPAPEKRYFEYPHQLSGGMRQRVMIAMAMSCDPKLLIADEPTTALDVTIQAQILDLMRSIQKDFGSSTILITHDLGVVAEMCNDVAVMYAGKIIEYGTVNEIFNSPQHPYTKGLLESIPHFDSGAKLDRLKTIPGMVPSLYNLPKGCHFRDRCFKAQEKCQQVPPVLSLAATSKNADHQVSCHFPLIDGGKV